MTSFASSDIWLAFIMTLVAAISTFMGAMTSLYFRKVNQVTLAIIWGFVAGIMIYTAFMKLMPDSISIPSSQLSYTQKEITSTVWFFVGIVLLCPLGYLVKLWKKKEVERYRKVSVQSIILGMFIMGVVLIIGSFFLILQQLQLFLEFFNISSS